QAGKAAEPAKLIVPMVELFMKSDRAFKPKRERG
ncbi:MAG: small protein, partial [Caulobacter sp. 35-67-4]